MQKVTSKETQKKLRILSTFYCTKLHIVTVITSNDDAACVRRVNIPKTCFKFHDSTSSC
jgi:hypothetical protein